MALGTPMAIIKLEIKLHEAKKAVLAFKENRRLAFESLSTELRKAISFSLNELLNAEIDLFLGNPGQEGNKRNG